MLSFCWKWENRELSNISKVNLQSKQSTQRNNNKTYNQTKQSPRYTIQVEPWRKYLLSRSCSCALNCQPYERSSVLNKKINIFFFFKSWYFRKSHTIRENRQINHPYPKESAMELKFKTSVLIVKWSNRKLLTLTSLPDSTHIKKKLQIQKEVLYLVSSPEFSPSWTLVKVRIAQCYMLLENFLI